jgi:hypothetical protein
MRRAAALVLMLVVAAAVVVLLLRPARSGHDPTPLSEVPRRQATPTGAPPAARASPAVATAIPAMTAAAFNHRLRCVDVRQLYGRLASTDVLALLCERKPLAALAIEVPLAEAGDLHAVVVLATIAYGVGACNAVPPPAPSAGFRARALERAQKNGASAETLRRLDDWLSEEEQGPTPEELAACRQATDEMKKLQPELMTQVAGVLGRPLDPAKDSNPDSEIEYLRRTLAYGDAEGAEQLAAALLSKGTPESDAEAVSLLRDAARTSASAKAQLGRCLLRGCPTPAAEPDEAVQLLTAAASEGNLQALLILTGEEPADEALLPSADRYAWGQMLQRLNDEGCFGASMFYVLLSRRPGASQNLGAMSPADAAAAQARAHELLGAQLAQTRARLGCD